MSAMRKTSLSKTFVEFTNGRVEESSEEGEFEDGENFEDEESGGDGEVGSKDEDEDDILHRIPLSNTLTNIAELPDVDFGSILEAQRALSKSAHKPTSSKPSNPSKLAPSKPSQPPKSKPKSKNRPQELSSKHPVSRKHFLPPPTHTVRDPRFETLSGPDPTDEKSLRKEYSFLETYQADEMAALKKQVKQAKSEDERARLRVALQSLRERGERRRAKERAEEVLRERAREEREKIKMGKQPFYLKKSTFVLVMWWLTG